MPPLFSCCGCGVQIERSRSSYIQQKGQLLCSTCRDRVDSSGDPPAGPDGEQAPPLPPDPGGRAQA